MCLPHSHSTSPRLSPKLERLASDLGPLQDPYFDGLRLLAICRGILAGTYSRVELTGKVGRARKNALIDASRARALLRARLDLFAASLDERDAHNRSSAAAVQIITPLCEILEWRGFPVMAALLAGRSLKQIGYQLGKTQQRVGQMRDEERERVQADHFEIRRSLDEFVVASLDYSATTESERESYL